MADYELADLKAEIAENARQAEDASARELEAQQKAQAEQIRA
jgi:hypothetical protein